MKSEYIYFTNQELEAIIKKLSYVYDNSITIEGSLETMIEEVIISLKSDGKLLDNELDSLDNEITNVVDRWFEKKLKCKKYEV